MTETITFRRGTRELDPGRDDGWLTAGWSEFLRDDPGHPLGHGMPTGGTLREDGDTHREAWMRVLRADPCAFCGARESGTVDHIDNKRGARPPGGLHVWLNYVGACTTCNGSKGSEPLLPWLARRRVLRVPLDAERAYHMPRNALAATAYRGGRSRSNASLALAA